MILSSCSSYSHLMISIGLMANQHHNITLSLLYPPWLSFLWDKTIQVRTLATVVLFLARILHIISLSLLVTYELRTH
jgi:hypothetical protein